MAKDGGAQGEIQFPGTNLSLPALPGLEYLDPGGSGLWVPVLGVEMDWTSGRLVPLAGTMEDVDGKGLVPMRIGARTVDPVTGITGSVVGARLDPLRKIVVPVIVPNGLTEGEATDTGLLDILQRECSLRGRFWRQQRRKEEELLRNLDRVLRHCFQSTVHGTGQSAALSITRSTTQSGTTQTSTAHVQGTPVQRSTVQMHWQDREEQLRTGAAVLAQEAQAEAQRRTRARSHLSLLLPHHVLLILTGGDEEQYEQQGWWQAELTAGLDRVSVGVNRLQQEQDRRMAMPHQGCTLKLRELWEQLISRQAELETALTRQHCVREHCQLRMDTAQAFLLGTFWYKDFRLTQIIGHTKLRRGEAVILPLLQKLLYLLEEQKQGSHGRPGAFTGDLMEATKTQEPEQGSSATLDPWTNPPSVLRGKDSHPFKEPICICVPALTVQDWDRLLELSPLFHQLKQVEEQLRDRARQGGLLAEHLPDRGCPFVDVLDAQWECEGELVPLSPDSLNPREFLVYQHGLFLLRTLHSHAEIPAVTLQVASSLPFNNYHHNAFRNSFFYQEAEKNLFVRRQRLWSEGGFSLLLLHCVSHIAVGNLCTDNTDFQRVFFQVLQLCLSEYFLIRLGAPLDPRADALWDAAQNPDQCTQSALLPLLVERVQKPAHGPFSREQVLKQLQRHRETSGLWHLENLLRETRSEVRKGWQKPLS
ncbi:uncharacterized protein LOC108928686 isoform X2 [Scleropages formosus]|uniref:uncharacterized protein LOC108928686 isoform X2 n=1 Tax=Scleropages formosus TaxID=113540 RepID=UPI0010FA9E1B|nr:uncharacterized protein LOC108928686 isoform X2 [Scleropages formosus]